MNGLLLDLCESLTHFAVLLLQLQQLFVTHVVWVRPTLVLALLDGPLQQALLLSLCRLLSEHAVHHDLHHDLLFALPGLLVLNMNCHHLRISVFPVRNAIFLVFPLVCPLSLDLVVEFLILAPKFVVLGPEVGDLFFLLLDLCVFLVDDLNRLMPKPTYLLHLQQLQVHFLNVLLQLVLRQP